MRIAHHQMETRSTVLWLYWTHQVKSFILIFDATGCMCNFTTPQGLMCEYVNILVTPEQVV